MPNWNIYEKWGRKMWLRAEVTSYTGQLVDTPAETLLGLFGGQLIELLGYHDVGRSGSRSKRELVKAVLGQRYGEEGVKAYELHHTLDYLKHLCNPQKLAGDEIFSMISKMTSGTPLPQRVEITRNALPELNGRKIEVEKMLGFRSPPKSFVVNMLFRKAERLEVSGETKKFIQHRRNTPRYWVWLN